MILMKVTDASFGAIVHLSASSSRYTPEGYRAQGSVLWYVPDGCIKNLVFWAGSGKTGVFY